MVSAIYFASRPIMNVVAVSLIVMSMFAIAGVQLYAGQLDTCRYVCVGRGKSAIAVLSCDVPILPRQ